MPVLSPIHIHGITRVGAAPAQFAPPALPAPRPERRAAPKLLAGGGWRIALSLLVVATFLIRARYLGNPFIQVDEQFYLLVGDRMLHGAVPYVDIWDRKPVGLFLLYAAIRLLGGEGILQYQLIASAFAAATAVTIAIIARRIASPGAALIAGLAYIPALAMSGGAGGQTPVFYNLPVALAALILIDLALLAPDLAEIRRRGALAMLLVGVAMQIKYSALFEGVYFGCVLIALAWRARLRGTALAADAALWAGIALLPTLLAFGFYAGMGQAHTFLYANFLSIGDRGSDPLHETLSDLRHVLVRLAPFLLVILAGESLLRRHGASWLRQRSGKPGYRFVIGWLAAAFAGFASLGAFYSHYALPLLVPLAVACAPTFAIAYRGAGKWAAALVLLPLAIAYPLDAAKLEKHYGDAAYAQDIARVISANLHGGCPYVFYGQPILYHLSDACLPSRWAFPFHLSLTREANALGVDAMAEVTRIMNQRPPVVVDRLNDDEDANAAVQRFVRARLARDYRLIYSHPNRARTPDFDQVWALRG